MYTLKPFNIFQFPEPTYNRGHSQCQITCLENDNFDHGVRTLHPRYYSKFPESSAAEASIDTHLNK